MDPCLEHAASPCGSCDHFRCHSLRLKLLSQVGADIASQHQFLTGASESTNPYGVERGSAVAAPGRLHGHFPAIAAPPHSSYRVPFPYAQYPMGYLPLPLGHPPPQKLPRPLLQVGNQQPTTRPVPPPPQQHLPPPSQVGNLQPPTGPVPPPPLCVPVVPSTSTAGYSRRIWL